MRLAHTPVRSRELASDGMSNEDTKELQGVWANAYNAAMTGLLASGKLLTAPGEIQQQSIQYADYALQDYRAKWPEQSGRRAR